MKARLAAFLVVLSMIGAAHEASATVGNTPSGEALTISNTGSPNFTQGATGCTSTSVSFNSNSFVTCNSGAWAVQPVQIGTSASAPQTCSSGFEGMMYLNSGSGTLYYCDNANTWESIDSSAQNDTGDYYIATATATPSSGQGMFGGSSTLGGVLAGFGSTADVTLENRSNTPALEVLGNSTNIYMPGNVGIGTSTPLAHMHLAGGSSSQSAWGTNGVGLREDAATYTDTSSSGAVSGTMAINSIAAPTLTATNVSTYAQAATLYIAGPPTAGSNVTITSNNGLYVNGAASFAGTVTAANLSVPSGNASSTSVTVTANSTANANMVSFTSNSTSGTASSNDTLLNIARSGANASSSHTAYGLQSSVTDTGTNSTNIGGLFSASGGTNNYGLLVTNGNVGIGTTSPAHTLDIVGDLGVSSQNFTWDGQVFTNTGNNFTTPAHIVAGFGVGVRGNRGGVLGMDVSAAGATSLGLFANSSEVMTLRNTGSVGIGNTSPLAYTEITGSLGNTTPVTMLDLSRPFQAGQAWASAASFNLSGNLGTNNTRLDIKLLNANDTTDTLPDTNVMTLLSGGNVGIGTTSPAANLDIEGSGSTFRLVRTNGGQGTFGEMDFYSPAANTRIASVELPTYDSALAFYTKGDGVQNSGVVAERMRIDYTGNVGIGTTAPGQLLDVNGTARARTALITPLIYPAADSTTAIQIDKANGSTNVLDVDTTNGRVGIGITSPIAPLHIAKTAIDTTGNTLSIPGYSTTYFTVPGAYSKITASPTADTTTSYSYVSMFGLTDEPASNTHTATGIGGLAGYATNENTSTISAQTTVLGVDAEVYNTGNAHALQGSFSYAESDWGTASEIWGSASETYQSAGTSSSNIGLESDPLIAGGSTALMAGLWVISEITGGSVTGDMYGGYIVADILGGTVANRYGLYIDTPSGSVTGGGDDFGIYVAGSQKNYFGGKVGIGTTSPQSKLQISGGEVQVGSSGLSCASNNAGAISYSSGSLNYCNGSTWTSTGSGGSGLPSGASQYQMIREGSSTPQWENAPYDVASFMPSTPQASSFINIILPRSIQLPSGLPSSQCLSITAATASTTVTINKISGGTTTAEGTAVWAASAKTCTFTFSSPITFAAGDMVQFAFPSPADATLANVSITLAGIRQ